MAQSHTLSDYSEQTNVQQAYHRKAIFIGVVRQEVKRSAGRSGFMGSNSLASQAASWIQFFMEGGSGIWASGWLGLMAATCKDTPRLCFCFGHFFEHIKFKLESCMNSIRAFCLKNFSLDYHSDNPGEINYSSRMEHLIGIWYSIPCFKKKTSLQFMMIGAIMQLLTFMYIVDCK